jgi:uroporphyrinogen decarboxylase
MPREDIVRDFRAVRENKTPRYMPCVAQSEEFDVKWYGKYDYESVCQDGDKIFEVWKAAIEEFDYDWAWVQIDDCFEFEPVGVKCVGDGDILRATCGYLEPTREVLEKLPVLDPEEDGRMPEKLKAIRKLRNHFGDSVLVTGSCAAPFSAVGLTFSIEESMMLMMTDPDFLHDAMEYWKKFYMRYIKAQADAGAHAIWLGDCNAFSGLVGVEQYNRSIFQQTKELVDFAENEVGVMIWMHNSEICIPHVKAHSPMKLSFESIGPGADIAAMHSATRESQPISGNLDPIEVLWRGTPESISKEVERIVGICKPGGGYIFSTGEMNPRDIPEKNMHAMMRTAKKLAKY